MRYRYLLPVKVWVLLAVGVLMVLSFADFGDPSGIRSSCARAGGMAVTVPEHDVMTEGGSWNAERTTYTSTGVVSHVPDQYYCAATGESGNVHS